MTEKAKILTGIMSEFYGYAPPQNLPLRVDVTRNEETFEYRKLIRFDIRLGQIVDEEMLINPHYPELIERRFAEVIFGDVFDKLRDLEFKLYERGDFESSKELRDIYRMMGFN
ncbi:hypothetical protein ABXV18_27180 [Vibrio owensii]|uniref:hypothetical protein n=1 Tax=Vibrio owensii TaxID=696485 RepID=UPI00339ABF73